MPLDQVPFQTRSATLSSGRTRKRPVRFTTVKTSERGAAREFQKHDQRFFSANTLARGASRFRRLESRSPETPSTPNTTICQLDFSASLRGIFLRQGTRSRETRTRGRARPRAATPPAQTRALANTRRLARGGRISAPRARVSPVVRDARTAPRGGDARDTPAGVGHQKRIRVERRSDASGRRAGRDARGRGSVTGSGPHPPPAPCG